MEIRPKIKIQQIMAQM